MIVLILIQRTNGISIMNAKTKHKEKAIEDWKKSHPGEYISHRECESLEIPSDRIFRNAWIDTGKGVEVDLTKAKEIHKQNLRVLRDPLMKKLDIEFMKAVAKGDTISIKSIEDKKQQLRDITIHPIIDSATTVQELKLAIPSILVEIK